MRVIDTVNLIEKYCRLAREISYTEHCAIAMGKKAPEENDCYEIVDYCALNELGGQTTLSTVIIPRRISYALIKACSKMENIPIVLHTHTSDTKENNGVSFSDADREYIRGFSSVAVKSGYVTECLFIVTDGATVMLCKKGQNVEEYIMLQREKSI